MIPGRVTKGLLNYFGETLRAPRWAQCLSDTDPAHGEFKPGAVGSNGPRLTRSLRLIHIENEQVLAEFQARDVIGGACSAVATAVDANEISVCVEV